MNNQSTHISHQEIRDYLSNQLSDPDMHRIEHHMLHCEFCAEAMEGYELLEEDDDKALVILQDKLGKRTIVKEESLDYKIIFAVAASLLLIMWGTYQFFNTGNRDMDNQIAEVVVEEPQEEEKPDEKTNQQIEDRDADTDSFTVLDFNDNRSDDIIEEGTSESFKSSNILMDVAEEEASEDHELGIEIIASKKELIEFWKAMSKKYEISDWSGDFKKLKEV
ncbi:MAG: hypothetical protein IH948_05665 [Bacteroidetes bacterium]|nr:hypothetical protein [Bacteroidota bacterium]